MRVRLACAATAALVAACSATPERSTQSPVGALTTRDGAFTSAQAQRGKAVYDTYCFSCHPTEFYDAQLLIWEGASAGELFEALSATMPSENPGALATNQYLDVLAYIFSITGSPSGYAELTAGNMYSVRIAND